MKHYTIEPDKFYNLDDLKGDLFNPDYIDHLTIEEIKVEEKKFEKQVTEDGVWGCIVWEECRCCGTQENIDSCWGFLGVEEAERWGEKMI